MNYRILSDKIVTAKKQHRCDASAQWWQSGYTAVHCETADQRLLVEAAEADKWRILPGQAYRHVTAIDDRGELVTYKARPGMDAVCAELDMWDET